ACFIKIDFFCHLITAFRPVVYHRILYVHFTNMIDHDIRERQFNNLKNSKNHTNRKRTFIPCRR
ncbi:MAG: hypothetical protein OEV45_10410, partial [Desulfobacteraceae bacterium]|nr:hypothetical protein [Desulfobacteraceae bacterium]